jgi:hypothetical protein
LAKTDAADSQNWKKKESLSQNSESAVYGFSSPKKQKAPRYRREALDENPQRRTLPSQQAVNYFQALTL